MTLLEYILLFGSVVIGGGLAFFINKDYKNFLRLTLSFSGAYILGITVLHLLPEVYHAHNDKVGYFILGGFLLQLFLEWLSKGVEHGHIHAHHQEKVGFAIQVLIGLSIHAFLEGMPLSHDHVHDHAGHVHHGAGHQLLYGILLHKLPASFALVSLLLLSGYKKWLTALFLLLFAMMSPFGALFGDYLNHSDYPKIYQTYLMAVVIGSFLHISTTILFESDGSGHHHFSWSKTAVVLIGIGAALLTVH